MPTFCAFAAMRVTTTLLSLSALPGKRAASATLSSAADPLVASPVSFAPLGVKTRDTYSRDPPLSKNAFALSAMWLMFFGSPLPAIVSES